MERVVRKLDPENTVGELRWKRPKEPDAWEGVKICNHFEKITPQYFPTPDTP